MPPLLEARPQRAHVLETPRVLAVREHEAQRAAVLVARRATQYRPTPTAWNPSSTHIREAPGLNRGRLG